MIGIEVVLSEPVSRDRIEASHGVWAREPIRAECCLYQHQACCGISQKVRGLPFRGHEQGVRACPTQAGLRLAVSAVLLAVTVASPLSATHTLVHSWDEITEANHDEVRYRRTTDASANY